MILGASTLGSLNAQLGALLTPIGPIVVYPTDTIDVEGEYLPLLSVAGEYLAATDLRDADGQVAFGEYLPALTLTRGTFGVNIMATKAVLGRASGGTMFVGEDKTLRLTGVVDAAGVLINIAAWTIHFVGGPLSKAATVSGVYNVDPLVNTQVATVTLTAAETAVLQATHYSYSWKRIDSGFNDILAYGEWPVQLATQ